MLMWVRSVTRFLLFGSFTIYTLVSQEYGEKPKMLGFISSYTVYAHAGQKKYKILFCLSRSQFILLGARSVVREPEMLDSILLYAVYAHAG